MKTLIATLLLGALSTQIRATPNPAIVEACLRTESVSPTIVYTPFDASAFEVIEDVDAGKTTIVVHHENGTVGTWERKKPPAFGLIFNGKETPLTHVVRLGKSSAPTAFNAYEAMWGMAQDDRKSYICATFNFDGLGKSGSLQNLRGLYLIERGRRAKKTFYTMGNIASGKK